MCLYLHWILSTKSDLIKCFFQTCPKFLSSENLWVNMQYMSIKYGVYFFPNLQYGMYSLPNLHTACSFPQNLQYGMYFFYNMPCIFSQIYHCSLHSHKGINILLPNLLPCVCYPLGSVWGVRWCWGHFQHFQTPLCWNDVLVLCEVQFW